MDSDGQDGTSPKTAWASITYAAKRVPKGAHVIDVGAGTFKEEGPITPASGVHVKGAGSLGPARTLVVPPADWEYRDGSPEAKNGYLFQILRHDDVTLEAMAFENNAAGGAKAAVYVEDTDRTRLLNLHIQGFNLSGIIANRSRHTEIAHSTFVDTAGRSGENVTVALDRQNRSALGAITLIFVKPALIHHNDIYEARQIGIKGFGIEAKSLLYANHVRGAKFGLETPHKSDSGLRVFNNVFDHWISVPKNGTYGPGPDGYNIRIHDNVINTPVGGIEGPRSFLEVDHNLFVFSGIGRVYENHGGRIDGPVWIHHNVSLQTPMGFYWDHGSMSGVHLVHNTVFFSGTHGHHALDLASGPFKDFSVLNNVFVSPASKPGGAITSTLPNPLAMSANIFENIKIDSIPESMRPQNKTGAPGFAPTKDPRILLPAAKGLALDNALPLSGKDFSGRTLGHPVVGTGPDVGAFEAGAERDYAPCDGTLGSSIPASVACQGGALILRKAAPGDWVTTHLSGLAPGTYTLRAGLRAAGTEPLSLEVWTGPPGDLSHWTLPVVMQEAREATPWLGEVTVGEAGELSIRLLLREGVADEVALETILLTPRFLDK